MNFAELQREIYAINCEKGWHQEPLRDPPIRPGRAVLGPPARVYHDRVLAKLALIHSELTEALDEWASNRKGVWYDEGSAKPEGFIVEIADAVIRTFDTCEALDLRMRPVSFGEAQPSVYTALLRAHGTVSAMAEATRVDDFAAFETASSRLPGFFDGVCELYGLDLWAAVRLKIDYNKTRPHRHGGKRA